METLSLSLSKLRKINLSDCSYINDKIIVQFFKNNEFLEKAKLMCCYGVTTYGIASALRERPTLKSLSLSGLDEVDDISFPHFIDSLVSLTCLKLYSLTISDELLSSIAMKGIPLDTLVLESCFGYNYEGIFCLVSKCRSIHHLDVKNADFLNDQHVAELSLFLPNLVSIILTDCWMLTDSALFALVKNCPSINSLQMTIETESVENSNFYDDFVVNYPLKSLRLDFSPSLQNEHIIRNLNLNNCSRVKLLGMNFEAPKLEVLNLSNITVYDETLYVISKGCPRLLQLILQKCVDVTNKGVKYVLENCTQLRKINLKYCDKVDASGVASMVFSRPSKITFSKCTLRDKRRKRLLSHGCVVDGEL